MSEERKPVRRERELTWEAVRQRNSVERIKEEKLPFDLIDELPRLAETPYEAVDEADILRLQWWGLYHDKPKIGEFMMRVKIAGGIVTPAQLKAIAEISRDFGEGSGEITTRQCIQIHHLHLPAIPEVFARLKAAGLTTSGACGDILRNITGCPVAGISQEELFDPRPAMQQLVDFFYGNRDYSDLPRKHKWTMACCHYHCNAPEMHDVGLIGAVQDGVQGFAITVGGGLSTVPRIAKSFGVFAAESELLEVMRGILDEWSNDLNYRRSRGKARFKFMIDDHGPDAVRERVEARLGRKLTPLKELPQPIGRTDHMGVHPQKQAGLHYVGVPVFPGIFPVDKMLAVAELAAAYGDDIRFTREQNFIITGVPTAKVDALVAALADLGYRLDGNAVRHHSIGCTGNPLCNFAVGDTKPRLVRLVDHLEARFGERIAHLRIHLDGCPHACGQHWVGDIGIQGTTLTTADGKVPAYDILLRGALGPGAAIAKAVGRRVPSDDLDLHVERLIAAYLDWRKSEESIQSFFAERSDDELKAIMQGEAAALAG